MAKTQKRGIKGRKPPQVKPISQTSTTATTKPIPPATEASAKKRQAAHKAAAKKRGTFRGDI